MTLKIYRNKIVAILLFLTLIPIARLSAQASIDDLLGQDRANTITSAVPFLMIAPDARSAGMGDAGVSSRPDVNSMHWNPAKYAFIEQEMGLAVSYTPWLRSLVNDINLSYLTGFHRIDDLQTVAASLLFFSLGNIQFTDINGNSMGTFRPNEFAVSVAYARKLGEYISGGITARYIHSDLTQGQVVGSFETRPGRSIAADVSAFYQRELEWQRIPASLSAGINISNIGNKISYSDQIDAAFIPINLRFGPTLKLNIDDFNTIAFSLDINKLLVPTPPIYQHDTVDADNNLVILRGRDPNRSVVSGMFGSFSDAPGGFSEELQEFSFAAGIEYWYDNQFAIRGGYFHEHERKGNRKFFTLGLGLKYNVFGLDFAYIIPVMQISPLADVMRFSLIFDFDAIAQSR